MTKQKQRDIIMEIMEIYDDHFHKGEWRAASDFFDSFDPFNDSLAEVVIPHLTMTGPGMIGDKKNLIQNREEILMYVRDRLISEGRNADDILRGLE